MQDKNPGSGRGSSFRVSRKSEASLTKSRSEKSFAAEALPVGCVAEVVATRVASEAIAAKVVSSASEAIATRVASEAITARVASDVSEVMAGIATDGHISVDGGIGASGLEVAHLAAVGALDTCH